MFLWVSSNDFIRLSFLQGEYSPSSPKWLWIVIVILILGLLSFMQYKFLKSITTTQKRHQAEKQTREENKLTPETLHISRQSDVDDDKFVSGLANTRKAMMNLQGKTKKDIESEFKELSDLQRQLKGDLNDLKSILSSFRAFSPSLETTADEKKHT